MILAFLLLPCHFLLHLLSCLHLLIEQFFLLLLLCLLLLISNQIFDHVCLGHVLIVLLIEQLFLLHFFLLGVVDILFYLFAVSSFVVKDFLSLLLFLSFVKKCYLRFLVDSHLLSKGLLVVMLHVSSSLINNVACLLSSLLYFFESPRFFLFKQLNSIGKKTEIILGTFPCKLGCN